MNVKSYLIVGGLPRCRRRAATNMVAAAADGRARFFDTRAEVGLGVVGEEYAVAMKMWWRFQLETGS